MVIKEYKDLGITLEIESNWLLFDVVPYGGRPDQIVVGRSSERGNVVIGYFRVNPRTYEELTVTEVYARELYNLWAIWNPKALRMDFIAVINNSEEGKGLPDGEIKEMFLEAYTLYPDVYLKINSYFRKLGVTIWRPAAAYYTI